MTNNNPDYLYHYTSIKGLTYILQTQQIRFAPLTNMDDKLEGVSDKLQHFKKYIFVSSWTDSERESIPFWNMYASQMCGIRIKLPKAMFISHTQIVTDKRISGIVNSINPTVIDDKQSFGSNYWVLPTASNFLYPIEYKKIDDILIKNLVQQDPNGAITVHYNDIGRIKSDDWAFQSEWRFRAIAAPIDYNHPQAFENVMKKMLKGDDVDIQYLYAQITPLAFSKMEILLGPKADQADELIIKALCKEYNPQIINNITKSILQIK